MKTLERRSESIIRELPWTPRQCVENLILLQGQTVNILPVLAKNKSNHAHYVEHGLRQTIPAHQYEDWPVERVVSDFSMIDFFALLLLRKPARDQNLGAFISLEINTTRLKENFYTVFITDLFTELRDRDALTQYIKGSVKRLALAARLANQTVPRWNIDDFVLRKQDQKLVEDLLRSTV